MNFLPIATRDLLVTARRRGTYYWRSFAALNAACLTLAFVFTGFTGALSTASAGLAAFQDLTGIGYAFAACAAAVLTADCISEERREGTLGLLLLTDLNGFDIVLGKLSRLANPLYCLAAAFPTVGFALMLGGVSVGAFFKVGIALLNTLFFFAALGLLISARSSSGRNAVLGAIAGVLLFSVPGLVVISGGTVPAGYLLPTPLGQILATLSSRTIPVPASIFLGSFFTTQLLAWAFIAAASFCVTHSSLAGERRRRSVRRGAAAPVVDALDADPVTSMVTRVMGARSYPILYIVTLAVVVFLFFVAAKQLSPSGWFDLQSVMIVAVGCHVALKFSAAHNACRCLAGRRQSGELELLLTTPLEGEKLVRGSAISLKRQLIWPVLFVIVMDCALMIVGWHKDGFWEGMPWAFLMLVEVVWFFANLYSLTVLGMCLGLKCASHAKALGRTLFYVLFLPWSGLALVAVVIGVCTMGKSFAGPMTLVMILEFFVLVAMCNLGFAGWAGGELRDRFRLLAAENFLQQGNEGNEEKPKGRELLVHTFKEVLNGLRG